MLHNSAMITAFYVEPYVFVKMNKREVPSFLKKKFFKPSLILLTEILCITSSRKLNQLLHYFPTTFDLGEQMKMYKMYKPQVGLKVMIIILSRTWSLLSHSKVCKTGLNDQFLAQTVGT